MRKSPTFAVLLFIFLSYVQAPSPAQIPASPPAIPTFFGAGIGEAAVAYHLILSPNRSDVTAWNIDWGDGKQSAEPATNTGADHLYENSGRYAVQVKAQLGDGTPVTAGRDYSRLIQDDHPSAATDVHASDTGTSLPTLDFLAAMAANRPVAKFSNALENVFARPADRFSVEFWLRPNDLAARQELLDAKGVNGTPTRLFLENNALCLALGAGDTFILPLATHIPVRTWHHVALTYDRAQTFPFSNIARFYLDGVQAGEYHLDKYDTGAVEMPAASIGAAPDGSSPLSGSIAEVALYDRWLNPVHLLDRARPASGTQIVVIAPKNAQTFTVDQPRITTTVDVALDPDSAVDNAPKLRAAIQAAGPGTRLRVINAATKNPGGRFYFSSLASGNDWTVLRVVEKTDFELDGGGADFVFRSHVRQLSVKQCTRTAFRHFSIDLDQDKYRVACYAKILDVDATSGTVRLQFVNGRDMTPDKKVPSSVSMWRWRSYDSKTLRILSDTGMYFQTHEVFGKTMARDPADPSILVGHTTSVKMLAAFEKYWQGANFLMVNNAHFPNTTVSLWDKCSQITFDHVNFYACLGMVFLSTDYDHLWVTHCRIGLPPGMTVADRPLAAAADGYHFHGNQGYTLFEDNEITLTDDDPITIKDGILRGGPSGTNSLQFVNEKFHLGDEIEIYRDDLSPLNYTATVTAMAGSTITLDKPLPADLPRTLLAQNHREHSFNWVIRNSYFHDFYGRFLLYTPWARITGNEITRSYLHIGTGAASFDGGGISSNVLVDNNILIDTDTDTGLWGVDSSYPVFKNITFAGNSFVHRGITLRNSRDALVANNYFENVVAKKGTSPSVMIHTSIDPRLLGNTQAAIGLTTFGLETTKTQGLTAEGNEIVTGPADASLKSLP